ncbi:Oxidoreductase NAD-binding domain-containing protein 1 [Chelonia mydas]|uniref:Oxidoreductase NAD-binding domain-containing protein 1 n=1 Tax=Chelonia mydas TaxID=8469 RepID=M7BXN4_CHEMY|nr:Oxidoreductase NAD-binding domain-containing protein 1 [Chelonia mydas]
MRERLFAAIYTNTHVGGTTATTLVAEIQVISPAKVCGITNESETVKRLRLAVTNKDFTFKAGQWVDFFIPEVAVVGGFSICSSPGLLEQERVLELAVKHTVHPPAHWIHTQCSLDSEVALRVGGNFFFDPQPADSPVNLVLIAGGVGINPLFSILLHVADFHRNQESEENGYKMGTVKLYYSAKNTNELLFKNNIFGLMNEFPGKITCSFHVTQQSSQICEELQPYITAVTSILGIEEIQAFMAGSPYKDQVTFRPQPKLLAKVVATFHMNGRWKIRY